MNVKIVKKNPKDFDPKRDFESPSEAAAYCSEFPEPDKRAMEIVQANVDMGEYGFASELVAEMETLPTEEEELLAAKNAAIQDLQNEKGKKKSNKYKIFELAQIAAVAELKLAICRIWHSRDKEMVLESTINISSANSIVQNDMRNNMEG